MLRLPVTQLESESTPPDDTMGSDSHETGEGGVKRSGATPASAEHVRKKVKDSVDLSQAPPRKLVFAGFTVQDCGAEGSCGYNAIAVGSSEESLREFRVSSGVLPICN